MFNPFVPESKAWCDVQQTRNELPTNCSSLEEPSGCVTIKPTQDSYSMPFYIVYTVQREMSGFYTPNYN